MAPHTSPLVPPGCEPLEVLVGRDITAVYFVADYLQVVLDREILSFYAWPTIYRDGEIEEIDSIGYEKSLRGLIGQNVERIGPARWGGGFSLTLTAVELEFAPGDDELSGPEILELTGSKTHSLKVWRHGDPPFARDT
jgi:hypothetical protein